MIAWVRIVAWVLIIGCAPGVIYSLFTLDWLGVAINAALLAIGVIDLNNVKLMKIDPVRAQHRMSWTQLALGAVIGVSFAILGQAAAESDYWDQVRSILNQISPISDHQWRQFVGQSMAILKWGTLIGGVLIFLSQVWIFLRLRAAKGPPPIPGG